MPQMVAIELEVPDDLARFRLPPGVNTRLQGLLDRQDSGKRLTAAERKEAQGARQPRRDAFAAPAASRTSRPSSSEEAMSDIPDRLRRLVVLRAGDRCEYCRLAQKGQEATFHIDHILPKVAGGWTAAANLALACVIVIGKVVVQKGECGDIFAGKVTRQALGTEATPSQQGVT